MINREHGLPVDTVRFAAQTTGVESAHISNYINVTNVGLYLLAVVAAFELKLINRPLGSGETAYHPTVMQLKIPGFLATFKRLSRQPSKRSNTRSPRMP